MFAALAVPASAVRVAAGPGASPQIPMHCLGVTMHLEPGARQPDGSRQPGSGVARDLPLDPVVAQAPLYPGAVPSGASTQGMSYQFPDSGYDKTAAAEYALRATVEQALRWYRSAFPSCGYQAFGYGSGGGPGGGSRYVEFVSPTTPSLRILVSLAARLGGRTLLLYYASAVSAPPRPRSTVITGYPAVANVVYWPRLSQRAVRFRLTNPLQVQMLSVTVDLPTGVDAVVHGCSEDQRGAYATVVFHYRGGRATRVLVNPDCYDFSVNGSRPLIDENRGVWSYVGFLAYRHCFEYGCALGRRR